MHAIHISDDGVVYHLLHEIGPHLAKNKIGELEKLHKLYIQVGDGKALAKKRP